MRAKFGDLSWTVGEVIQLQNGILWDFPYFLIYSFLRVDSLIPTATTSDYLTHNSMD